MAGIVTHLSCLHPDYAPFPPIFPHFPSDMWLSTPPHSPPGQGKVFFGGFGATLPPFFHKKSANSHSRFHFPHFSYLEQFSNSSLPAAGN